jgi:plastocyanin
MMVATRRVVVTVIGMVTVLSGLAATGVDASSPTHAVVIEHGEFKPQELRISAGDTVTWTNNDGDDAHSVTADDGAFDSSPGCTKTAPEHCLHGGDRYSHTFPTQGRYPYHSNTEGQHGVVIVT